jgi:SPP1 family predicted phage head-tail adaptor
VWAAVEPLSVREFVSSKSEQSEVTARIVIRYRHDVNGQMRFIQGNKIYNIIAPLPDPDSGREYLTLAVSEGVSKG